MMIVTIVIVIAAFICFCYLVDRLDKKFIHEAGFKKEVVFLQRKLNILEEFKQEQQKWMLEEEKRITFEILLAAEKSPLVFKTDEFFWLWNHFYGELSPLDPRNPITIEKKRKDEIMRSVIKWESNKFF